MAVVSVKDVAERAGVSIGTVSNVMNHPEKVAEPSRARVLAAIEELGFSRNDAARQLREGRSRSIGFIVLDVRNPFFTEVARGAEDRAAHERLSVLLANSDQSVERESAHLDLFEQQRVHGVLISPIADVTERLATLRERGIPAVLVDRAAPDASFSSVSVDDLAGGRMAVHHLIARGRRRLAYLGRQDLRQSTDRLQGARAAVAEHPGVTLEVIELDALSVSAGRAVGAAIAARSVRPDAIFAANDLVAIGVLEAFMMGSSRISVPDDIAIIGYDDIDFASAAVVPLSSIRQPAALMGRTAVELLLDEAADPASPKRQVEFQPDVVVRASTTTID